MHGSGHSPVTYLIGRSREADIVLEDMSVSRLHAELVAGRDGTWYLTDRASSGGTCRLDAEGWAPIRQEYVHPGDRLRLGRFECTLDDLLRGLSTGSAAALEPVASRPATAPEPLPQGEAPHPPGATAPETAGGEPGEEGTPVRDDRPAGAVRRDPGTGEILSMEDE